MDIYTFNSWVQSRDRERHDHIPAADKVLPLIAQAGQRGMSRSEIGKVIELDRDDLDALLAGLVQFGLLRVTRLNGFQVFHFLGRIDFTNPGKTG